MPVDEAGHVVLGHGCTELSDSAVGDWQIVPAVRQVQAVCLFGPHQRNGGSRWRCWWVVERQDIQSWVPCFEPPDVGELALILQVGAGGPRVGYIDNTHAFKE
jgi:hypothetical protein